MNKYRGVRPIPTQAVSQQQSPPLGFSEGFRGDAPSLELPPNSAAQMLNLRHDRRGIRKDIGLVAVGDAAPERVLAIGEFKTITETEILHRTFRIYRGTDSENLGLGVCEFWDGSGWSLLAISDEPIAQTYLSTVNLQNVLAVADGFNVFIIKQVSPPEFAVQATAPAARYLFSFADRLVALQDGLDRQSLAWTVSGDVEDWTGVGSGQIFLVDARVDAVDDLMAGAPIGSNIAAIIRKRSIMRAFPTGNELQAIGATHWIEGIGTESRFSLQVVPGGVIFLGHNLMVYYLTEQGPTPIGVPIFEELEESLSGNLELVDSGYDQIRGEYWLAIPEFNSDFNTSVWIFDVKKFLERQELVWRKREQEIQRIGATSSLAADIIPPAPTIISTDWFRTAIDSHRVSVVVKPHPSHLNDTLQLVRDGMVVHSVPGPHVGPVEMFEADVALDQEYTYTARHTSIGIESDPATQLAGVPFPLYTGGVTNVMACSYRVHFQAQRLFGDEESISGVIEVQDDYNGSFEDVDEVDEDALFSDVSHGSDSGCPNGLQDMDVRIRHRVDWFGTSDYSPWREYVADGSFEPFQLCDACGGA